MLEVDDTTAIAHTDMDTTELLASDPCDGREHEGASLEASVSRTAKVNY